VLLFRVFSEAKISIFENSLFTTLLLWVCEILWPFIICYYY